MELGIQGRMNNQLPIQNKTQQATVVLFQSGQNEQAKQVAAEAQKAQLEQNNTISREEIERYIQQILKDASILNRDLRYSINRETDKVIVKVVDRTTEKVIKEIPPEALQRLQAALKKQLGLIIDEEI